MSADKDFAEALLEAQIRAAEGIETSTELLPEEDARTALRALATLCGIKPDSVVTDFDAGGPLADLVRVMLGIEARRQAKRGPRPKLLESWLSFIRIVELMRGGLSQEAAIAQRAAEAEIPDDTVRSQYRRTRGRDGIDPASVPASTLVAIFSDPRR